MSVSLIDASQALDERKDAVFSARADSLDVDQVSLLVSGFDLDVEELRVLGNAVAASFLDPDNLKAAGATAHMLVRGAWVEGLMTGLMLTKLRADEEALS